MDDLSQLSDEQLAAYRAQNQAVIDRHVADNPDALSGLSDEELAGYRRRQQAVILAPARQQVQQEAASGQGLSEGAGAYLGRQAISAIRAPLTNAAYAYSKGRLSNNEADEGDLRNIALFEHEQGINSNQPEWAKWAGTGAEVAGNIAPTLLSGGANIAAQAYTQAAAQRGEGLLSGGAVMDAAPSFLLQMGVLKAMGPLADKLFPGAAQSMAGRVGSQALTGTVGMEVGDYAAYATGLSEHGGPVKDALDGKWGDAARGTFANVLFTGGMAAAHGGADAGKKIVEDASKTFQADTRRGVPVPQAAEAARAQAEQAGKSIIEAAAQKGPVAQDAPSGGQVSEGPTPVGGPESPAPTAQAEPTPEFVEEMRARLQAVGIPAKRMKPAEVVAKARGMKLDQFGEKSAVDPQLTPTPSEPAADRRQDLARRKTVAEMTPEERAKELLTSSVVDLPNRRAFDEAGPAKAVGMSDADGLKALNDKFGYEAGNALLRAKGEALKEAGLDAYHEKGDEFLFRGASQEELSDKLTRARSILKDKIITAEMADGTKLQFKGADFSHGTGPDLATAEAGLKAHKQLREAAGERARGELRGIAVLGPEKGQADQRGAAPADHGPQAKEGPAIADLGRRFTNGEAVKLDDVMKAASLGRQEQHVIRERLEGRTLEAIAKDPELSRAGITRQRVEQIERNARKKLGLNESLAVAVHGQEKADGEVDKIADGRIVDPGELKADPAVVKRRSLRKADLEERRLDGWADYLEANGAKLSQDERAGLEGRIRAGEPAPAVRGETAERPAGEPAPVRRAGGEPVPGGAPAAPAPVEGAGPPAPAHPGGAAADAGGGQAPGDQLNRPVPPFERAWRQKAAAAGISYDDLKKGADQFLAENAAKVDEHNEIVRRAMESLDNAYRERDRLAGKSGLAVKGFNWSSVRALAGEDDASVFGIDGVAQELAGSYNRPNLGPAELFDMLKEGIRRPLTKTEAHQAALDEWTDHQEADRARKEAQRSGWPRGAAEEALRRGQADGEAEAADREGDASGGDRDDLLAHDVGHFDPAEFGRPLSDAERRTVPGGGQPSAGERTQRTTALANVVMEAERRAARLAEIEGAARRENAAVWDQAQAKVREDPQFPFRLTDELARESRATTVDENAVLLQHKIAVRNEYNRVAAQYIAAMTDPRMKDAFDFADLEAREKFLAAETDKIDTVTKATGTEWGRAGQFRKQLAAEDFSLAGMLQKAAATKGEPLTDQEKIQIGRLQQKIESLQAKLDAAEKAYTEAGSKPGSKAYGEMQSARVAATEATGEFQSQLAGYRRANQSPTSRVADWLIKLRVNEVISSPTTLAKIANAAATRFVTTPMEEAAGSFWSKVPGLAKVAAMAPREGRGLSLVAEKQAIASGLTQGFADAWKSATTGRSDLDILHGKPEAPRGWLDLQFGLHDAMKAPAVRAEYTRSWIQRMDAESAAGKDPTTPAAQLRITGEAYKDAQAAKFRQENWLVDAYNRFTNSLRASDNGIAQATGVGLKLLTPVVRVPTNLAFEVANHAFGVGVGTARLTKAWMNGIENLKPNEADAIMRNFKKGSLGAAALLIGYLNPQTFGGYYSGRRDDQDVKAGGLRVGGVDVPSWLLHNPLVETLQLGATVRRASDKVYKGQEQGTGTGIYQGLAGWVEEIPLAREGNELAKAVSPNPRERGRFLGETAKSFAVPQLVQWLAGQTDKKTPFSPAEEPQKRHPEGVWQDVETGVPGLRQRVPAGR